MLLLRMLPVGPGLKAAFSDDFTEMPVQRLKKQNEMRIRK